MTENMRAANCMLNGDDNQARKLQKKFSEVLRSSPKFSEDLHRGDHSRIVPLSRGNAVGDTTGKRAPHSGSLASALGPATCHCFPVSRPLSAN